MKKLDKIWVYYDAQEKKEIEKRTTDTRARIQISTAGINENSHTGKQVIRACLPKLKDLRVYLFEQNFPERWSYAKEFSFERRYLRTHYTCVTKNSKGFDQSSYFKRPILI